MKELKNLTPLNNNKLLVVLPINRVDDLMLNECAYRLAEQTYKPDVLVLVNGLNDEELSIVKTILDDPQVFQMVQDPAVANEAGEMVTPEPRQNIVRPTQGINYVIEHTDNKTFSAVYNEAYNIAITNKYEWISVIEPHDILEPNWYNTFELYASKKPEYHGFMPFIREIINGNFIGFMHEANWVDGFAEVPGVFDFNLLLRYNCINLTGSVLNVEAMKPFCEEVNGYYKPMKESIKVSALYEFFLRMVYNDLKFYTIPRTGYECRSNTTVGLNLYSSKLPKDYLSLPVESGGMTQDEYRFWTELAKNEYFFPEDRSTQYVPTAVTA